MLPLTPNNFLVQVNHGGRRKEEEESSSPSHSHKRGELDPARPTKCHPATKSKPMKSRPEVSHVRHGDKIIDAAKKRNGVRFAPRVRARYTIHLDDYTTEEAEAVWGTEEDRERNQEDVIRTVGRMRTVLSGGQEQQEGEQDGNGSELCTRGLEHMRYPEDVERRQAHKRQVVDAVLDEQDRQWLEHMHNSRELASASRFLSAASRMKALDLAAVDSAYVQARRRSSQLKSLQLQAAMARERRRSSSGGSRRGSIGSAGAGGRRRSSRLSFEKHGDSVVAELLELRKQVDQEDGDDDGDKDNGGWTAKRSLVSQIDQGFKRMYAWQKKQSKWENLDDDDEEEHSGEVGEETMDIADSLHIAGRRLGHRRGVEKKMSTIMDDHSTDTESSSCCELDRIPAETFESKHYM